MSDQPLITVLGATGAQGGGLARAILADPARTFAVRAITRKPEAPAARKLAAAGADVRFGDLDDAASLEPAFAGAHGVFAVTNFWEHFSPERELAQAGNIARAAQKAGVRHVIWSTLEDTRQWVPLSDVRMPTLMSKYKVPHFDAKGESNRLFTELGVPTTFLLTSFYWENLIHFGMGPKRGPNGKLAFTLPMADKKLPGIAAEDIGRCAYGILKKGPELRGRTIGIAGEHLTGEQMSAELSNALDQEVRYNAVSPETFRALGFPGAEDLGNMFQFKRDFEGYFCGARNPDVARSLNASLQSFRAWINENKRRIPLE
jgi:uncharacterized protein YbjT (DUF2867 family)